MKVSIQNEIYLNNLNVNNCNCRLTNLYNVRDNISKRIDTLLCQGYDTTMAEEEYNEVCNIIEELCSFRRRNPGCLCEGDPGYCFN